LGTELCSIACPSVIFPVHPSCICRVKGPILFANNGSPRSLPILMPAPAAGFGGENLLERAVGDRLSCPPGVRPHTKRITSVDFASFRTMSTPRNGQGQLGESDYDLELGLQYNPADVGDVLDDPWSKTCICNVLLKNAALGIIPTWLHKDDCCEHCPSWAVAIHNIRAAVANNFALDEEERIKVASMPRNIECWTKESQRRYRRRLLQKSGKIASKLQELWQSE
jgi:hypothetical protein